MNATPLRRVIRSGAMIRRFALCALVVSLGVFSFGVLTPNTSRAMPPAPKDFCGLYPQAKACASGPAPCATCHTVAPALNLFGAQVASKLGGSRPRTAEAFLAALPAALRAVENQDADNDGASNLVELMAGTQLADASSKPATQACSATASAAAADARWNTCGFDAAYALRKVNLDFCGRSPSRADTDAIRRITDRRAVEQALGAALDRCLTSSYWLGTNGVVWNMANNKIRPVDSIKSGARAGAIPLADYEYDYNLFSYANSGDRDVRDLLLAQYFVRRTSDAPPTFALVDNAQLRFGPAGQAVAPDKRVGMITTRWFTTVNTMFTAMPRTTAAQAYRSYLGMDISKMEGLHPVLQEPIDYDGKGVEAPECAVCHSTLDPLTYPFTRYNGIASNNYQATRMNSFVRTDGANVANTPEAGIIFGQRVANLLEWGQVAANSEPFAQNVVRDYWKVLIGREPQGRDARDFTALWKGLMSPTVHNYRVEKMLHALILTDAYGTP